MQRQSDISDEPEQQKIFERILSFGSPCQIQ